MGNISAGTAFGGAESLAAAFEQAADGFLDGDIFVGHHPFGDQSFEGIEL